MACSIWVMNLVCRQLQQKKFLDILRIKMKDSDLYRKLSLNYAIHVRNIN